MRGSHTDVARGRASALNVALPALGGVVFQCDLDAWRQRNTSPDAPANVEIPRGVAPHGQYVAVGTTPAL